MIWVLLADYHDWEGRLVLGLGLYPLVTLAYAALLTWLAGLGRRRVQPSA